MVKILLICGGNFELGGVENYLLNTLSEINHEGLAISLLVPGRIVSERIAKKIEDTGCKIRTLNLISKTKIIKYLKFLTLYRKLKTILASEKYDVVHVNTGSLPHQAISLLAAKKENVKVRIAHSHSTMIKGSPIKEFIRNILRKIINSSATEYLACSEAAAVSLFGEKQAKKARVANNGIKADNYIFDAEKRESIRREYGWDGHFVVGLIGRIAMQKNQLFMLRVIDQVRRKDESVLFVMVGGTSEKEYEEKVRAEIKRLGLESYVQLLGEKNNIPELVQGMDLHVLPSVFEGLPIVNIEAQAAGLRCLCSGNITREADITGLVEFIPLEKGEEYWAERVLSYNNGYERKDTSDMIKKAGYDIKTSSKIIEELYRGTNTH